MSCLFWASGASEVRLLARAGGLQGRRLAPLFARCPNGSRMEHPTSFDRGSGAVPGGGRRRGAPHTNLTGRQRFWLAGTHRALFSPPHDSPLPASAARASTASVCMARRRRRGGLRAKKRAQELDSDWRFFARV